MGIGADIGNAVGTALGMESGTTLDDFLSKFSSAAGSYVNTIDPLHTFDVQMKFYPLEPDKKATDKNAVVEALKGLANSATQAVNNLANNATGGIAGAIANAMKKGVIDSHNGYSLKGKETFMKYLAEACLLINADNLINMPFGSANNSPLELNLSYYVQAVSIPQFRIEMSQSETLVGKFPVNGLYVMPDNSNLNMSILNTKLPLLEMIFYPWMREVTLPYWSYETQPYTTATIIIDMNKHADIKYEFYGCRPVQIQAMAPTQEPDTTMTRDVSFAFDYVAVTSTNYKTHESVLEKIVGTAAGVAGSAAGMMNL